ncbi:hypothetical protein Hanom_Chr09g00822591 [Helianthus anomalus]
MFHFSPVGSKRFHHCYFSLLGIFLLTRKTIQPCKTEFLFSLTEKMDGVNPVD